MFYGWGNGSPRSKDSHRGSGRCKEDAGNPHSTVLRTHPRSGKNKHLSHHQSSTWGRQPPLTPLLHPLSTQLFVSQTPLLWDKKKNSGGNCTQVGELAIYAKLQLKLSNDWVGGTSLHFNKFNISNSRAQGWHQGAERTL